MPKPANFQDLFRAAEVELLQRNGRLRRDIAERPGSDVNILLASMAGAADEVMGQNLLAQAALYIDSAQGDDLDRLLYDRYGLLRKQAAPSAGYIELTTTIPNPTAFSIPTGTLFSSSDGLEFGSVGVITFPALSVGPITVLIQSSLAGISQQAQIGTITSIVSTIVGAPSDLVCINSQATAGAGDAEDDTSFRDRGRRFFTSVSKATKKALETAALNVPGVITAVAFELFTLLGEQGKQVEIVISDSFTTVLMSLNPTPPTYQVQAQALAAIVQASLDEVRAYGIEVRVIVAVVVLQPIRLQLTFEAGADTTAVTSRARGVVLATVNALQPGVSLTVQSIIDALSTVPGLVITGGEVIVPQGTVVPDTLQVIRTSLALISVGA